MTAGYGVDCIFLTTSPESGCIALEPIPTDLPLLRRTGQLRPTAADIRREESTVARREGPRGLDRQDYTQGYIATPRGGS